MINKLILVFFILGLLISCDNSVDPNYDAYYDSLSHLSAKEAIAKANEWKFSAPKITSYVTTKEVIFEFPDRRNVKIELPNNEFYLAVAPYLNHTHSCEIHYTSSCDGEMKERTFEINALDEHGNLILNNSISSMRNGFFELWLPRNKSIKLQIKYNTSIGEEILTTSDGSRTCITTIKLK